ncbi:MAG: DNA repair protein RadC [Rhodospirillaceae bacterium]|nr:DNA repair protein RadC [Rhodospirillales bacterium]
MTADPILPGLDEKAPHYVGHRERLRERFIANPDALPDYEMLELLLATAIPRKDVKPIAKALIDRFGGFAEVITADYQDLVGAEGLGPASAAVLKVVQEAALRLAKLTVMNKPVLSSWDALLDYCNAAMARLPTEQFRLLFLNHKNVLIADELQQKGTVDHTPLYPREVVKRALALNASAIIMIHNHPSGDPTPSKADMEMTRAVRDALKAVSITLHDHLIVGRKGHTSFKSVGLL